MFVTLDLDSCEMKCRESKTLSASRTQYGTPDAYAYHLMFIAKLYRPKYCNNIQTFEVLVPRAKKMFAAHSLKFARMCSIALRVLLRIDIR